MIQIEVLKFGSSKDFAEASNVINCPFGDHFGTSWIVGRRSADSRGAREIDGCGVLVARVGEGKGNASPVRRPV
jgi:hypothetical protein